MAPVTKFIVTLFRIKKLNQIFNYVQMNPDQPSAFAESLVLKWGVQK